MLKDASVLSVLVGLDVCSADAISMDGVSEVTEPAERFGSAAFLTSFLALPGVLTLVSRRVGSVPEDDDRFAVFFGGVVGTFSAIFDEEACVGRIIRAKKLSSTGASFLT
jgi:hypothetical protein